MWVQQKENGYMNMKKWKKCEAKKLPIDIKGSPVYVGFDMSAKIDLTSVAFVIPYRNERWIRQVERSQNTLYYHILLFQTRKN